MEPFHRLQFLAREECVTLLGEARAGLHQPAQVTAGLSRHRQGAVVWWQRNAERGWLFDRLAETGNRYAADAGLDTTGLHPLIQVAAYQERGRFDWHIDLDTSDRPVMKITMVVQLSSADDYRGGDLELVGELPSVFHRARGSLTIFPTTLAHRVTRLESGSRYSLVAWMSGPPFR